MHKTIPLLKYVVPFIAGIVLSKHLLVSLDTLVFILLGLVVVVIAGHSYLKSRINKAVHHLLAALLYGAFFVTGILLSSVFNKSASSIHLQKIDGEYATCQVIDYPEEKERTVEAKVKVLQVWDEEKSQPSTGNAILYLAKDSDSRSIKYGDIVYINLRKIKTVDPPKHTTHFNLKRFYASKNISYTGFLKNIDWYNTGYNQAGWLKAWSYTIRAELLTIFKIYFPNKDVRGMAEAVVFGYKEDLNPQWLSAFSKTGTIHVLAVSGLHVGIIYILLATLLQLNKRKGWVLYLKAILILLLLFGYSLLTGFAPSVSRASLMFGLVLIASVFQRQSNIYNTLCFAALVLLAINPFNIYNVGFQFSFLAVLGIVYYKDRLKSLWPQKYWLSDKVATLVAVSIAAQLTTFPLGIYYFHQYPNFFMFSNLIVIPVITLVVYGGLAVAVLHFISKALAKAIAAIVSGYITFIADTVHYIQNLPYAFFENIYITGVQTVLLFMILVVFSWYLLQEKKIAMVGLVVLVLGFLVEDYRVINKRNRTNEVVLFSNYGGSALIVKNGARTLVLSKGSYTIGEEQYEYEVKPYLIKNRLLRNTKHYPIELGQFTFDSKEILSRGNGLIMINGESYFIIDYLKRFVYQPIEVDYVVVNGGRSQSFYEAVLPKINYKKLLNSTKSEYKLNKALVN